MLFSWLRNYWRILLSGLLLSLLFVAGRSYYTTLRQPGDGVVRVHCDDLSQPCVLSLAPLKRIVVQSNIAPTPLKPFELHVSGTSEPLVASFSMPTMNMGENRYPLIALKDQHWYTTVVLPFCAHGRRDWLLRLQGVQTVVEISFVSF